MNGDTGAMQLTENEIMNGSEKINTDRFRMRGREGVQMEIR